MSMKVMTQEIVEFLFVQQRNNATTSSGTIRSEHVKIFKTSRGRYPDTASKPLEHRSQLDRRQIHVTTFRLRTYFKLIMFAARHHSFRIGALASARVRCANAAAASTFHPDIAKFANVDPDIMSPEHVHTVPNLVNGKWSLPSKTSDVPDPLTGKTFLKVADTQVCLRY